jgi:hypothetical protein
VKGFSPIRLEAPNQKTSSSINRQLHTIDFKRANALGRIEQLNSIVFSLVEFLESYQFSLAIVTRLLLSKYLQNSQPKEEEKV